MNWFPELDLDPKVQYLAPQMQYRMAVEHAPGCLDVLPYEYGKDFVTRVAALVGPSADTRSLTQHYERWFADPINSYWLPHIDAFERLENRQRDAGSSSSAQSGSRGFSAVAGIPRTFTADQPAGVKYLATEIPVLTRANDASQTQPGPSAQSASTSQPTPAAMPIPSAIDANGENVQF